MLGAAPPDDGVVGIPYSVSAVASELILGSPQNPLRLSFRPGECQEARLVIQARTGHLDDPRDMEGKEDS